MSGSIDQGLKEQAIKSGVKIFFNKALEEKEVDIVATGPRFKHIAVADKGIVFQTDLPNTAIGIVNNEAAFKGYSYLLIADGVACLCACIFDDLTKLNDCFEFTKNFCVNKYKLKIHNPKLVGGVGYFSMHNKYKEGKTLFVGESAGIQDFLWGFGMRTAIVSGYLAAISIIQNLDYEKLARQKFTKHIEAGIVNRFAWEHVDIDNFLAIAEKLHNKQRSSDFLRSNYNFNLIQHIEYPIALNYVQKKYPEVLL